MLGTSPKRQLPTSAIAAALAQFLPLQNSSFLYSTGTSASSTTKFERWQTWTPPPFNNNLQCLYKYQIKYHRNNTWWKLIPSPSTQMYKITQKVNIFYYSWKCEKQFLLIFVHQHFPEQQKRFQGKKINKSYPPPP